MLLAFGGSASALTLHVSPEGRDTWSGVPAQATPDHTDGPLASLGGARDALRRRRAAGQLEPGDIHIVVAAGEYTLTAPLVLEPQDGGTEAQAVIYEAASGAHPLFSGGRKITGFKPISGGLWQAEVPGAGQWQFEQLFVNGQRATRARTPNADFFQAVSAAAEPVAGVKLSGPFTKVAIQMRPEDLSTLQGLSDEELHDVNTVIYHSWQTSRHRLAGMDADRGTLQFTGAARWAFFQFEPYHRFFLENYRAAVDAPGEWFLDREGLLFYMPRKGEDSTTATAVAPAIPRWLELRGKAEEGRYVDYVQFRGLHFADSQYLLPEAGWSDAQADALLGAAIEADGVRHVSFEDCEFSHSGSYVLWFRHGCHESRVTHCHLHEMGSGGIKIGEATVPKSEAGQTDHIAVENNIIQNGGRYFQGSVGVWVGHSGDNAIVHNDIGDFYYSAISLGWVWGFKPSLAVRNRVEWNHLHHLGWGVLSDMGAVYLLGPAAGTVVTHNRIHDVACYSYGGWGLYTDEGSTGVVMEDNLVYRTESAGFHQHYGKENIVRNNIFAGSREMQIRHSRPEDHLAFTFEQNIVLWSEGKLFGHTDAGWQGPQVKLARNLYWKTDGADYDFAGKTREAWLASGQDAGSVFADPKFVEPEVGDFDLPADSPAFQIGFQPFHYAKAGVEGDPAWIKLAAARQYPRMDFGPMSFEPPPLQLHEGFEYGLPGSKSRILKVQNGGRENAAVVTGEAASKGKQSLKISDGPDLQPAFNPHFYFQPRHRQGVTRVTFDLRVEAAAEVSLDWRNQAGQPYVTGPSLRVKQGALWVRGQRVVDFPALQWVHVEMEAQLGGHSPSTWTLRVTLPDLPPKTFEGLKFVNAEAKSLEWLGFSSPGTAAASYWLDEIDISNRVDKD